MSLTIVGPLDTVLKYNIIISFSKKSFPASKSPSQYVSYLIKKLGISRKKLYLYNSWDTRKDQTWWEERSRYKCCLQNLSENQKRNIIYELTILKSQKKDWGILRKVEYSVA